MTKTIVGARIRAFEDRDYGPAVAINNRLFADHPETEAEWRYYDRTFDRSRYFEARVALEDAAGNVIGWGRAMHSTWEFQPDKYRFDVQVDPERQRRGFGAALYDHLLGLVHARGAVAVRVGVRESMPASVEFARRRGFVERQREWESRLDVAAFDPAPFASALPRVVAQGVDIVTVADVLAGDPAGAEAVHDLYGDCNRDVPSVDPVTTPPFAQWRQEQLDGPNAMLNGFFLAREGNRYLALSELLRTEADPAVLYQGLTGVRREARGRGLAMALKLQTVAFARSQGFREIRTWNDTRNRPMLRINEALGFARQPAWIEFERRVG